MSEINGLFYTSLFSSSIGTEPEVSEVNAEGLFFSEGFGNSNCCNSPGLLNSSSSNSIITDENDVSKYFVEDLEMKCLQSPTPSFHETDLQKEEETAKPCILEPKPGIATNPVEQQLQLLDASEETIKKLIKQRLPNIADKAFSVVFDGIVFKQRQYNDLLVKYTAKASTSVSPIVQDFLKENKGWGVSETEEKNIICTYASNYILGLILEAKTTLSNALNNVFNKTIGELELLMSFSLFQCKTTPESTPVPPESQNVTPKVEKEPKIDLPRSISIKFKRLPKTATGMMENWAKQNIDHPYPSESAKQYFSQQTGLTMTQVNNWFINWRVRKWKNNPNHDQQPQPCEVPKPKRAYNKRLHSEI